MPGLCNILPDDDDITANGDDRKLNSHCSSAVPQASFGSLFTCFFPSPTCSGLLRFWCNANSNKAGTYEKQKNLKTAFVCWPDKSQAHYNESNSSTNSDN
jgi:hypothetical protein